MTIMLDNLSAEVTNALQKKATEEGRTVKEVTAEIIARGLNAEAPKKKRDLSQYRGKWIEDGEVDAALESFRKVDQEMWR